MNIYKITLEARVSYKSDASYIFANDDETAAQFAEDQGEAYGCKGRHKFILRGELPDNINVSDMPVIA